MRTISFSDARSQLKDVCDRVVDDADVTIITRRDAEDVVIMSLAEWNSWKETDYLLASPANARRLAQSLADARSGCVEVHALDPCPEHAESVHESSAPYKRRARKSGAGSKKAKTRN